MMCFHWQLFALRTLSFSVSIENFGFTLSTRFFVPKIFFLNCKMSKTHVNHSLVAVQCGSAEGKTAKLVEHIESEYCVSSVELNALQKL